MSSSYPGGRAAPAGPGQRRRTARRAVAAVADVASVRGGEEGLIAGAGGER